MCKTEVMETIASIHQAFEEETTIIRKNIRKEENLHVSDESLDHALECKAYINLVNDGYAVLFTLVDRLTMLKATGAEEEKLVEGLVTMLNMLNRVAIRMWMEIDSDPFLKVACKSSLLDLRVNIRSLKEDSKDLERRFLKNSDDPELDDLFDAI